MNLLDENEKAIDAAMTELLTERRAAIAAENGLLRQQLKTLHEAEVAWQLDAMRDDADVFVAPPRPEGLRAPGEDAPWSTYAVLCYDGLKFVKAVGARTREEADATKDAWFREGPDHSARLRWIEDCNLA